MPINDIVCKSGRLVLARQVLHDLHSHDNPDDDEEDEEDKEAYPSLLTCGFRGHNCFLGVAKSA